MSSGYKIILLKDIMHEMGENKAIEIVTSYSCPLNIDVEKFLRYKSIEFCKQNTAPTHLVFTSFKDKLELIGYFTLALKDFFILKSTLSKSLGKRVSKFGSYDHNRKGYMIPAPLIAQLGKNYTDGFNQLISGDELLKIACDKVYQTQRIMGGKIIYVECEDKNKLIDFYSDNGFVSFGRRQLDEDEKDDLSGTYLIQMLKYLDRND